MRYVIVLLIKGEAGEYHNNLVKTVGPKFQENYLVENPRPSHITLKSPFELKDSEELEKTLKKFVETHKKSEFKINGFDNFRKFVAFLKCEFSPECRKIQKELVNILEKNLNLTPDRFDAEFTPHITISYGNTPETFEKIWSHLKKLLSPEFNLEFDNITILKKPHNLWEVHKEFELK